jgi:hypothetical protein
VYFEAEDFSDVVRESQEIVELTTKGILRALGIEPPKRHDVGDLLAAYQTRLPDGPWDRLLHASKWLRTEREFSFYGDVDFIPTEEYSEAEAQEAIQAAELAIHLAELTLKGTGGGGTMPRPTHNP